MRLLTVVVFLSISSLCRAQEVAIDSIIEYVFENEFIYGEANQSSEDVFKIQFTSDKYLKLSFPIDGIEGFILMDNEREFATIQERNTAKIKRYSEMPPKEIDSVGMKFIKKEEAVYKNFECDIYEIAVGDNAVNVYFEKKKSITFNSFITKFLNYRAVPIDAETIPNGKIVLIEIREFGELAYSFELKEYSENQQIAFRLKTSE